MSVDSRPAILIVEDHAGSSRNVADAFGGAGWRVLLCTDGELAREIAGDLALDAVLVDIEIPGPSGTEVIRHLRAREADRGDGLRARVVVYTGYSALDPAVRDAVAAGADAVLLKPTLASRILAVVAGGEAGDESFVPEI